MAAAYQILSNPQSRESYDNDRLGHRGDPSDFDHDDFGGGGGGRETPRRRVYKTPKPVYDTYGAHGEPNLNQVVNFLVKIAGTAVFVMAAIVWCVDSYYKTDLYSTNIYLQELEKSKKLDSEKGTNDKAPD